MKGKMLLEFAVMSLYEGTKTRVRVGLEFSEEFEVNVGVHQGSVLSSLVFVIVVDVVTENVRNGLMSEMFFADDLVLTSETIEGLRENFWKWKEAFESKGLKVNLGKTKVVVSGAEGEVSGSKVDPCGIHGKRVMVNSVLCACQMREMDPWKMRESKEGDPEVGKRFCVWKMQASW